MTETIIAEHYLLGEKLGAGGMGIVYLGQDTRTEKSVAIKQLKPDLVQDDILERFKREGEALRDLNHPNIVKMLDALEDDGKHYLIMEYISGGDLSDLLKKEQLPLEKILALSIDLADALTRAHKLNIIHRDLKPANVLIGDDGVLRLTDFGVAHVGSKERVTDTDAIVGTIDYLPPEAFDSRGFDARGDIWAFGIMLFEMLTGDCPFKGGTVLQMVQSIVSDPIPDLESLRPDISTDLIDLIYRMLERDPLARIPSVRIIGAELEAIQEGRSTQTPPATRFSIVDSDFIFAIKKHNLPAQVTEFVGREHELAELSKLLQDKSLRLMTIIAPGGMGKTRLSLEAAERSLDYFEDGVFFVELAPLSNREQIVPAVASALDVTFQQDGREQKQQILDYLQHKQILLVMDNFEHLLDGANLVTEILNAAPGVQVLVTSRQRLGQRGETIFHLSGMDFPDWETPGEALQYAAVKLFVNSAKHALPSFELTGDNLNAVARICRLVQGMPLGIVLSGAWVAMLSPQEIASELEQNMDILSDESGELPERQQSIRAVMNYSWQMMSETEQSVFMKLSIFKGGFTREASEAVAGANLRILMSLVTKSLLRRDADSGRYEIHELLRQYAQEQLQHHSILEQTQDIHSTYYMEFVEERELDAKGRRQIATIQELNSDFENIRPAWFLACDQYQLTSGVVECIVAVFGDMLQHQNRLPELMQYALNKYSSSDNALVYGYLCVQQAYWELHIVDKIDKADKYIAIASKIASENDDLRLTALTTLAEGMLLLDQLEFINALSTLRRAIELFEETKELYYLPVTYLFSKVTDLDSRQDDGKHKLLQKGIDIARKTGNHYHIILPLNFFGSLTPSRETGIALIREALLLAQRYNSQKYIARISSDLAVKLFLKGELDEGRKLAHYSLAIGKEISTETDPYASSLRVMALFAALDEEYQESLRLSDEAIQKIPAYSSARRNFAVFTKALVGCGIKDVNLISKTLNSLLPNWLNRKSWLSLNRALIPCVFYYAYRENFPRAVELIGLAFSREDSQPYWAEQWSSFQRLKVHLQNELGEEGYIEAYNRGENLDLETVIQDLLEKIRID